MTFSLLQRELLETLGARPALGIIACLYCIFGSLAGIAAQPVRKLNSRSSDIVGWQALKDPNLGLLILINFFMALTVRVPTTFGPDFSETLGYSTAAASYLLATISGVGILTRPLLGYLADWIGHQNLLTLSTIVNALSVWALWLPAAQVASKSIWIAFVIFWGLSNGTFLQLANSVSKDIFGDSLYYSYSGAITTARGLGFTIGPPIAGAIVKKVRDDELMPSDFSTVIFYSAVLLTTPAICLGLLRWIDCRRNGWTWVR